MLIEKRRSVILKTLVEASEHVRLRDIGAELEAGQARTPQPAFSESHCFDFQATWYE